MDRFEQAVMDRYSQEQRAVLSNLATEIDHRCAIKEKSYLDIARKMGISVATFGRMRAGCAVSKSAYPGLKVLGFTEAEIAPCMALGLNGSTGHARPNNATFNTTSTIANRIKLIEFCVKTGTTQEEVAKAIGVTKDAIRNYVYGRPMLTKIVEEINTAIPMLSGLVVLDNMLPERVRTAVKTAGKETLGNLLDLVDAKKIHVENYDALSALAVRAAKPEPKPKREPKPKPPAPTKSDTNPGHGAGGFFAPMVPPSPTPHFGPDGATKWAPQAPQFADLQGVTAFLGSDGWTKVTVERVGVFAGQPLFTVKV